jgi:tetratricopeptide (TPR) repeat protein
MIMDLAGRDPSLLSDLELAAAAESADDNSLFIQFKKAIIEATRKHGFVEYRDARAWAHNVEGVLERIEALIGSDRAELALRLLDYFFARMDEALQNMDDSDGQGGAVYARGCDVHLAACQAAKPDPVALARDLFAREVESEWDFFHGASEVYGEVLGVVGLAEYRRLAGEAWKKVKPLPAGQSRQHDDDQFSARFRLGAILEGFAERDGDVEARIAIRAKDLSTAYAYLGIARLCLDHGRKEDALKWAEEGLWQFEDHPDERLVAFAADLYRRLGRKKDAAKLLWQSFERLPSMELYRNLKTGGGMSADATRQRVLSLLREILAKPNLRNGWSSPKQVIFDILRSEKLYSEAWQVAQHHGCSDEQLAALAEASEQTHPAEALAGYARVAERLAGLGGQSNYQQATKIIARMAAIRSSLGAGAKHAAYVAEFVQRHRSKRNLIKLLTSSGSG